MHFRFYIVLMAIAVSCPLHAVFTHLDTRNNKFLDIVHKLKRYDLLHDQVQVSSERIVIAHINYLTPCIYLVCNSQNDVESILNEKRKAIRDSITWYYLENAQDYTFSWGKGDGSHARIKKICHQKI